MFCADPETTAWRFIHKEKTMRKVLYTVGALAGVLLASPAAFATLAQQAKAAAKTPARA